MTVLQATGHQKGGLFVAGEPRTCVEYNGQVHPCPPWGLDTERLDCMAQDPTALPHGELQCTVKQPCPSHMRWASDEEAAAKRLTKAELAKKRAEHRKKREQAAAARAILQQEATKKAE